MNLNSPHIKLLIFTALWLLVGCKENEISKNNSKLFELIHDSGITFSNDLMEDEKLNYFTYPYLYMGGGVAAGDVNNDGLIDVFFTGNIVQDQLYLNQGDFKFENVTQQAGIIELKNSWSTGVSMADVNSDGYLDIYVCRSGSFHDKSNLLYINNGDGTFIESSREYNVADTGNSVQGSFLDFDNDGDLDLYVANYPPLDFKAPNFVYSSNQKLPKLATSDQLYRNDGSSFTNITEQAGVLNFGLTLSATVSDINNDGWSDIYVSNDFASSDIMYINNQDGTFTDRLRQSFQHTAFYGMGVDIADFNNDGLPDIYQVDMAPESNFRSKVNMASMDVDGFQDMIDKGLHYQYMENAFQLNRGVVNDQIPIFSDLSRITGTATTDWSWAPLIADFDNDGLKDLFVSNGVRKDINHKDFFKKIKGEKYAPSELLELSKKIPSQKIPNCVYQNKGGLQFEDKSKDWGLDYNGFSNGCAYADFDNDGDLDLIVNNVDDQMALYQNRSINNWIKVAINDDNNTQGLGTKVELYSSDLFQYSELTSSRGFQSSVPAIHHFGLGDLSRIDSLRITWPTGEIVKVVDPKINTLLEINKKEQNLKNSKKETQIVYFNHITPDQLNVNAPHIENEFNDFENGRLLPHEMSALGPGIASADINNDGLDDFFVTAASGHTSKLYIQEMDGSFKMKSNYFESHKKSEDYDAVFFDANNDGLVDLFVASGGSEFEKGSKYYADRLYLNDGSGLEHIEFALPNVFESSSRIAVTDFDNDGDLDLLVGGRQVPGEYGKAASSHLLENRLNKEGKFVLADHLAPSLKKIGMVTDLCWNDVNKDGLEDIVVVGEWMKVSFLINKNGQFEDQTEKYNPDGHKGWWFSVYSKDLNNDGYDDLVLGNLGQNYKYQASNDQPFKMISDDLNKDGLHDVVLSFVENGENYPLRGKQCSSEQIPELNKHFKSYDKFARSSLSEIYSTLDVDVKPKENIVNTFASMVALNDKGNGFKYSNLPLLCQLSNISSILSMDVNQDQNLDLVFIGNLFISEVETKRNDASIGMIALGNGEGDFEPISLKDSGFFCNKDARDMCIVKTIHDKSLIVVSNNNDYLSIHSFDNKSYNYEKI